MIFEITTLNHVVALIASLIYVGFVLKEFKDKRDTGKTRMKWKTYWSKQWDDFLWLVLMGQVLTGLQEFLYSGIINFFSIENPWDIYYDSEEAISFLLGSFGVKLVNKYFKYGSRKIDGYGGGNAE
jgi:hypothetical protein